MNILDKTSNQRNTRTENELFQKRLSINLEKSHSHCLCESLLNWTL
jgi:hypothetical protein